MDEVEEMAATCCGQGEGGKRVKELLNALLRRVGEG
jgi:hypothetical protein